MHRETKTNNNLTPAATGYKRHRFMARCYVGTYGKYNEGSLYGKWLDLNDYATYADFCAACKALHKNEHDPEFMIQDWENLPDGFPAVEWISESEFNDIKAAMQSEQKLNVQIIDYSDKAFALVGETKTIKDGLKNLGGRFNGKLSCGAGWVFPKAKLEAVQQFLNAGFFLEERAPKQEKDMAVWEEYKQRVLKAENNDQHWLDYWMKKTSEVMMTESGVILTFEKSSIDVDFCWSDEGPAYEEYKLLHSKEELMRAYFIEQNLREYDELIEELKSRKDRYGDTLVPVMYERSTWSYGKCGWGERFYMMKPWRLQEVQQDENACAFQLSENDAAKVLQILVSERAKKEKRLNTYLKRYGVSKLHTWTYWADR